jgi:protein tyrosine phosphatase (PTP) superfamily phosphohydrolase (DUF442 family)
MVTVMTRKIWRQRMAFAVTAFAWVAIAGPAAWSQSEPKPAPVEASPKAAEGTAVPAVQSASRRYEALPEMPGLEALYRLDARVVRGGAPVGDEGMESLKKLGIVTILSVEEDPEEQALAEKHGLKRVEVPLSYEGMKPDEARRIAEILNTDGGPFYIHCQHGKHRGGAAAGVYRRVYCGFTVEETEKELIELGCSKKYKGLIQSVREIDAAGLRPEHLRLADRPGITALVELSRGIYRGSSPEGDQGLESLRSLGVKSIVSLDALPEEGERARRAGFEYAEVPMGYDAVSPETARSVLKALDSLPKPVYVHCHRGHDRVGAAAAIYRIERCGFTNARAVEEMLALGCSKRYAELVRSIETYRAVTKD